jgi:serine/threonine-protein kinase
VQVADDARVGTLLAGYRLEALLGRGGMSEVYRAEDKRLKRKVVLKLLTAALAEDGTFRERFLRESRRLVSFEHPSIVPVFEAGEAEGVLFQATGHVEGESLASVLAREGRLEPERALAVVSQLAEGLDAARWGRGLVHGCLSPDLVVVAADGRVLLSGFGLRRELAAAGGCGPVGYLAAEQLEGRPVSPRTDVFGLGCLLFECLTGNAPFPDAAVGGPPPSARLACPGLPTALDRVLGRALAAWPEERYSTCGELAAAARAALAPASEQTQQALPEQPPAPVGAPGAPARRLGKRSRSALAAVALVVLLATLVAGAVWLAGGDRGGPSAQPPPRPPTAVAPAQPAAEAVAAAEPEPPSPAAEPAAAAPGSVLARLPGSLVRLDGATGEILSRLAIPSPELLASDGRSLWVLSDEGAGEKLARVEAATNAVSEIFDASGLEASALAAAGGSAWLGDSLGSVYRLAPGAGASEPLMVDGTERGSLYLDGGSLVAAAGSLWLGAVPPGPYSSPPSQPSLHRVDPETGEVIARIDGAARVVAAGPGFVWALEDVGSDAAGLVRIDTETNASTPIGVLDVGWTDLTGAGGAVWASSPADSTIVRLDPITGEEQERIPVGLVPGVLTAGGGAVWAASNDGAVARYDFATGRITTIDVGGIPGDLVFARGSIWVTVPVPTAWMQVRIGRQALTVDGVRVWLGVPTGGWERFGSISLNKSTVGPQGAEAIVFWTSFPHGEYADPCTELLSPQAGRSAAALAAAVSRARGTELVAGPTDVTVGGRAAKYVELTVREDAGCDPGYFYAWEDVELGAFWTQTGPGDTIRVWIVDVGGTLLFFEAETNTQAGFTLRQEIRQIIESIRFE